MQSLMLSTSRKNYMIFVFLSAYLPALLLYSELVSSLVDDMRKIVAIGSMGRFLLLFPHMYLSSSAWMN